MYENVNKNYKCAECVLGKIVRPSFEESKNIASSVGELTHADLMVSSTLSLGNDKYTLCLKDYYSRFRTVHFLK